MKKQLSVTCCIFLFTLHQVFSQVSGVKAIPGDYSSITEAMAQIKAVGVSGPVFLELQAGYSAAAETFPIKIREIPGISPARSITISPAAGVSDLSIIAPVAGSVFEFIGSYYVT